MAKGNLLSSRVVKGRVLTQENALHFLGNFSRVMDSSPAKRKVEEAKHTDHFDFRCD